MRDEIRDQSSETLSIIEIPTIPSDFLSLVPDEEELR